jgi:hypothetical protein
MEQNKVKKKPLYCCFVDFKKTFDIVPREVLWQVLASLKVKDTSSNACKQCMPRIPYASTTQIKVSPQALGASKV